MPSCLGMLPGLYQYHMMPNIMPIKTTEAMAKTECGKVTGR